MEGDVWMDGWWMVENGVIFEIGEWAVILVHLILIMNYEYTIWGFECI